ncbi:MFS general substrate transporter, partial [Laetiporus sulphureus 93-53]
MSDQEPRVLAQDNTTMDSESTSLLESARKATRPSPLPKLQLAVVYAVKLMIPLATTQSMPYINLLVAELVGSDDADTGYYSGLVGSAGSIAHILTIYAWGRLSDRYGRKPIIISGTALTAVCTLLFGLSRSFSSVLVTKFLIGGFSATTSAIHSVVGELTDSTNQATAFPLYDIVSAVGFALGPLIGGTFANPATEYPGWFDTPFWRNYPYFLPCLITTLLALVALFLAIFVLEETLPGRIALLKDLDEDSALIESSESTIDEAEIMDSPSKPLGVKVLLSTPVILMVCASSGALAFVASCFNTVFVLQSYTSVENGGLGLKPAQIGQALTIMGTVSIFLKLSLPPLLRRFGTLTMFRFCMRSWPVTFASMSLLSLIAQRAVQPEGRAVEWVAVSFVLFLSRIGTMAFSIIMLLTKDHTPGTSSLGTSNGLAEFAQSLAAVFSPTIVSSLFAFSVSKHVLDGHLWVIIMVVLAVFSGTFADRLKKFRD